jgi:hypothetical protein
VRYKETHKKVHKHSMGLEIPKTINYCDKLTLILSFLLLLHMKQGFGGEKRPKDK